MSKKNNLLHRLNECQTKIQTPNLKSMLEAQHNFEWLNMSLIVQKYTNTYPHTQIQKYTIKQMQKKTSNAYTHIEECDLIGSNGRDA